MQRLLVNKLTQNSKLSLEEIYDTDAVLFYIY